MAAEAPRSRFPVASIWRGLPPRSRAIFTFALIATVIGFATVISRGNAVDMQPLFTNLAPDDAAALVEELRSTHVPYEIVAGGTAVLVPAPLIHELRLGMASKGLPRGAGVGFEIFDRQTFGQSDFVQELNYRRALMGELGRTISQIDSVESARVHIVIPQRTLYTDRAEPARASVTVRLRHGRRLGRGQVDAVVHLVTSSIEGLAAEHVTVVDTTGSILSRGDGQEGAAAALEFRRQIEESMEERVAAILDRAVGPGRAVVRVAADVETTQVERTAETFDPDSAVLRSEQSTQERGATAGAGVGGTAGVRAALAGETGTSRPGGGTGSSRTTETKNYEVSKTTSREVLPSGKIQRLHVAVLIDEGSAAGKDGAGAPSIDDATVARLAGLVKRAVGFDAGRGDQVEIQKVRFAAAPEVGPEPAGPGVVSRAIPFTPHILTAGGLLVLLVLAMSLRRAPLVEPTLLPLPRTVRELENNLRAPAPAMSGPTAAPALLASRAAEDDHARSASVLRGWLGE